MAGGKAAGAFAVHKHSPEQCLKEFKVKKETGLSTEQAKQLLEKYGYNELEKDPPTPLWKLVLEQVRQPLHSFRHQLQLPRRLLILCGWLPYQFDDALVKILLTAACISFLLAYFDEGSHGEGIGAYVEPLVILIILVSSIKFPAVIYFVTVSVWCGVINIMFCVLRVPLDLERCSWRLARE